MQVVSEARWRPGASPGADQFFDIRFGQWREVDTFDWRTSLCLVKCFGEHRRRFLRPIYDERKQRDLAGVAQQMREQLHACGIRPMHVVKRQQ